MSNAPRLLAAAAVTAALAFLPTLAGAQMPIVCKGDQDLTLRNKVVSVKKGPAVIAKGDCTLILENATLSSPGRAVVAEGNADITLRNTTVHGAKAAVAVSGNATVKAVNSTLNGKIVKKGNGDFERTNSVVGPAAEPKAKKRPAKPDHVKPVPPAPDGDKQPHGPIKCVGADKITLKNRIIDVDGIAIDLIGACKLRIVDSIVRSKSIAISVKGTGTINIVNSTVRGGEKAISITGTGVVSAKGSTIAGGIEKLGVGRFVDKGGNQIQKR